MVVEAALPLNATAEVNSKQPSREGPTNEDTGANTVRREGSQISGIFRVICVLSSCLLVKINQTFRFD